MREGLLHCTTKREGKTVIFSRGSFLGRSRAAHNINPTKVSSSSFRTGGRKRCAFRSQLFFQLFCFFLSRRGNNSCGSTRANRGISPRKRFEWRLERERLLLSANNGGKKGLPFFLSPRFLCGLSRLALSRDLFFPSPVIGCSHNGEGFNKSHSHQIRTKVLSLQYKKFPFPRRFLWQKLVNVVLRECEHFQIESLSPCLPQPTNHSFHFPLLFLPRLFPVQFVSVCHADYLEIRGATAAEPLSFPLLLRRVIERRRWMKRGGLSCFPCRCTLV